MQRSFWLIKEPIWKVSLSHYSSILETIQDSSSANNTNILSITIKIMQNAMIK